MTKMIREKIRARRELSPTEAKIADLLLEACSDQEIAEKLNMPKRTVKANFSRMFKIYGVTDGIKRVKLAVALYRERNPMHAGLGEHSGQAHGIAIVDGFHDARGHL